LTTEDKPGPPEAEAPWEKNRRLRLAQIAAEQAHGEQLLDRYGSGEVRPRFAFVGRAAAKRRRR
jgi:hypothetical protein